MGFPLLRPHLGTMIPQWFGHCLAPSGAGSVATWARCGRLESSNSWRAVEAERWRSSDRAAQQSSPSTASVSFGGRRGRPAGQPIGEKSPGLFRSGVSPAPRESGPGIFPGEPSARRHESSAFRRKAGFRRGPTRSGHGARAIGSTPSGALAGGSWCAACRTLESRGTPARVGRSSTPAGSSSGFLGCAVLLRHFPARAKPRSGSMPTSASVLRRTGGRSVKSIVFDAKTIDRSGPAAGRRDHRGLPRRRASGAGAAQGKLHLPRRSGAADRAAPSGRFPGRELLRQRHRFERRGPAAVRPGDPARREAYRAGRGHRRQRQYAQEAGRHASERREPRSLAICALLDKEAMHAPFPNFGSSGSRRPRRFSWATVWITPRTSGTSPSSRI